jgi:hypothetical protein
MSLNVAGKPLSNGDVAVGGGLVVVLVGVRELRHALAR